MSNRRSRLLELLADRKWHSQDEMIGAAGHRFATVIQEAREERYVIETEHVSGSTYRYRLSLTPGEQIRVFGLDTEGQTVLMLAEGDQ